jgi:acid stress chaperone HdeB
MRSILAVTITALLLTIAPVRAETFGETIDMAEFKCSDLTRVYLEQFLVIDAWLSGYYHGKSGRTVIDRKLAAENTRKVVQFCKANPSVTVMQAIERLARA